MQKTVDLLKHALSRRSASDWSRRLNTTPSVFTDAKRKGHLSPVIAGNLAIDLGEDAEKWIAIAALEAERDSPMLQRLRQTLLRAKPYFCAHPFLLKFRAILAP